NIFSRAESHRSYRFLGDMSCSIGLDDITLYVSEFVQFLPASGVPDTRCLVVAAGCNQLAVRTKRDRTHIPVLGYWGYQLASGRYVPKPQRKICLGRQHLS